MVSGKSGKVREFDIGVSKGDNMSGFSGKPSRKVLGKSWNVVRMIGLGSLKIRLTSNMGGNIHADSTKSRLQHRAYYRL